MPIKRIVSLLTVAAALPLFAAPATAQMYPGEDITVNPDAIPQSAPGQSSPGFVLKPPSTHTRHRAHAAAKAVAPADTTASVDTTAIPSDTAPPPEKPKHHRAHTAASAPADSPANSNVVPFTLGATELLAPPSAKMAATEPPPAETAKPGKSDAQSAGLAKRGAILFEHAATDPQPAQLDGIRLLAGDLNSALEAGATRIQLQAFGGSPGDKSSDARRISLRRALAIRQLLIDNGVPASRIDVRAMGGATDHGEPDRVDIYVRAG